MGKWLEDFLVNVQNPWFIIFALTGQIFFYSRFIIQWIVSEKAGKVIIPVSFWYVSIIGSVLILIYGIYKREPALIIGYALNPVIYVRNLMLLRRGGGHVETEKK